MGGKMDAIAKQIRGSLKETNTQQADRAKIRTILGSEVMQEANLK